MKVKTITRCRYCRRELTDETTLCDGPICQAKRELCEYCYKFREAEELREEVYKLLARVQSCSQASENSGGSGGTHRNTFEEQMCRYLDLKALYETKRLETYEQALAVEYKIRELDSPYRDILRLKYIRLWTFEKIAVELNYDYRWLIRLYNKALKQYSEIDH